MMGTEGQKLRTPCPGPETGPGSRLPRANNAQGASINGWTQAQHRFRRAQPGGFAIISVVAFNIAHARPPYARTPEPHQWFGRYDPVNALNWSWCDRTALQTERDSSTQRARQRSNRQDSSIWSRERAKPTGDQQRHVSSVLALADWPRLASNRSGALRSFRRVRRAAD